jgi:hypothetical protein
MGSSIPVVKSIELGGEAKAKISANKPHTQEFI